MFARGIPFVLVLVSSSAIARELHGLIDERHHLIETQAAELAELGGIERYVFRVAITNSRIVGLDDKESPSVTKIVSRCSGGPPA